MKSFRTFIIALALMVLPFSASAQLTGPQGGTGVPGVSAGSIPFGGSSILRLATSSAFQYNSSLSRLTVTNASTTALTATTLCISTDCKTAWPAGTVAGSDTQVQFNDGGSAFGGDAGLVYNKTTDTLTTVNLNLGGDTIDEFVGTGLQLSSGDLQTTLGTTVAPTELASSDFGDFTCNGTTCTTDNGSIGVADLASVDFGDFTCNGSACTNDANSIALTTDTTGNYVETVSSSGSITVAGSGAEDADVTVNLNMGNANTWTALQTFGNSSTTNASFSGYASSSQWHGGGLDVDCDSDAAALGYDITTRKFVCGDDDSGAGGGIATIQEGDSDVTTSATVIDFGAGFDVTGASVEGDISLDLLEYNAAALFTNGTSTNWFSSNITGNTLAIGGTATTSISSAGTITIGGNIIFAGDTIDELVGAGLALSSNDLTVDNVTAAMLNNEDFGDFSCNGTTCTVDANAIALSTDTTGNYLATLADDGQSTITVNNSGSEGAAVTLRVIDVVCTDCLTTTEIADSYLLNNGDVGTGDYDFGGANFEIPNGSNPTVDAIGEIALDTTYNELIVATSTNASFPAVWTAEQKIWGRTMASSSVDFVSGGRVPLPPVNTDWTISKIMCIVDGGTSVVINVDTLAGGANTTQATCATTLTTQAVSSNNTLASTTAYAQEFGTVTGAVDYVTISVWGYPTRH